MKRLLDSLGSDLRYAWVGLAVAALVSVAWAGGATNKTVSAQQQTVSYLYSVKILCVPTLGRAAPALVPGIYQTAVNVHNPWPQAAKITKWLTLSPPQGQPAITGKQISETLEPFQAFDIDCVHMAREFGLNGEKVPGGKGFLIIQSDQNLDVVGVYTAEQVVGANAKELQDVTAEEIEQAHKRASGIGLAMDVEYIQPKITQVDLPDPDLTVEITSGPTPDCSNNVCNTTVGFDITNTSSVDVTGSFQVLIEATGIPSKTITVNGLAAGASQNLSETLSGFCFTPDCTAVVTVDSGNAIPESDETNNVSEVTILG